MTNVDVGGADRMRQAARLIAAITQKLENHQTILGRSLYGRITWRVDRRGEIEIDLEPKL